MQIAWEIYKTGEITYKERHANNRTFIGDAKNPIAIGRKKDLWANLDNEFYKILDLWRWHRSKLMNIDIKSLPYNIAIGIRYLTETEKSQPQAVYFLNGV